MYFIKGGPGVGKSSLMRRFAASAEDKGYAVEYFHCSSDPDSLDGVAVPECGIGMMDATAPHIYDPSVPGARDTLISLGDYLDEKALAPHAKEIIRLQSEISAKFKRCYRYLAAAQEVLCTASAEADLSGLEEEWTKLLPTRGGRGEARRLFASAFTPKGRVDVTDFAHYDRRVSVEIPFGAHASGLMERMAQKAQSRGLDVILLLDALMPDRAAHVIIPAHGVAFCTETRINRDDHEQGFDRNAYGLLCQRAVEQLAAAKSLHDELEQFYVRHMDFAAWQNQLDKLLLTLH